MMFAITNIIIKTYVRTNANLRLPNVSKQKNDNVVRTSTMQKKSGRLITLAV